MVEVKVEMPTAGGDGTNGGGEEHCGEVAKGGKRGKRKGKAWHRHKNGEKSRGKQDIERKAKVNDKIEKIRRAREVLEDPYDDMDIDTKKAHALFFYNAEMAEIVSDNEVAFSSKSVKVKKVVSKRVGVSKRTVGRWVLEYWCEEEVKKSNRGRHSKCESPMDNEEFRASFCQHVRLHAKPKGV